MREEQQSKKPFLVLIVDDELPIAQVIAFVVQDAGFRAVQAQHGREAMTLIQQQHPNLVITDLMMPQMSGRELIRQVRATLGDQVPPLVIMTAAGVHAADDVGADAVLLKPFEISDIEALLARFLPAPDPA